MVGNKADLKDSRAVKFTDGAKFCQENNTTYYECSAATGEGVEDVFSGITRQLLNKIESGIIMPSSVMSSYANTIKQVSISNEVEEEKKKQKTGCVNYSCFV